MFGAVISRLHTQALIKIVKHLEFGTFELTLPDGKVISCTGNQPGPAADLQLHNYEALSALMRDGKLGFCEAFMSGTATSSDPANLIELSVMHTELLEANL